MFIDQIKIQVKSGKGGDGCISFRREKYVPRGGPDGGDGGKGGNVLLEASSKYQSLSHLQYISHFKAGNGQNGRGKNQHGKDGKSIIIRVPQGTVVYKIPTSSRLATNGSRSPKIESRIQNPEVVGELIKDRESLLLAKGGKGGKGNTNFKTSKNRAPRIHQPGEMGESVNLLLELKLIADVGLVGYPNAGKSTLLSRISNATPKIADYPFTTLTPNLGVAQIDYHKLTIADIPGIIAGAHKGKGLGLEFLRHIERTRVLIFVLDVTQDPLSDYNTLKEEIREYNPSILKKPSIIALNKIDLMENNELQILQRESKCDNLIAPTRLRREKIMNYFALGGLRDAVLISALRGDGIDELFAELKKKITIPDGGDRASNFAASDLAHKLLTEKTFPAKNG